MAGGRPARALLFTTAAAVAAELLAALDPSAQSCRWFLAGAGTQEVHQQKLLPMTSAG